MLPHFDHKISSLGLPEANKIAKKRTTVNTVMAIIFCAFGSSLVVGGGILGIHTIKNPSSFVYQGQTPRPPVRPYSFRIPEKNHTIS